MKIKEIRPILALSLLLSSLLLGGCGKATSGTGENTASTEPSVSSTIESSQAAVQDISEASDTESEGTEAAPDSDTQTTVDQTNPDNPDSSTKETRTLTLSVVNMCGIEIGMVSVIDPATGEQINLDSLSNEESISMEANWPVSVTEFRWALYNTEGELCVEGTTNISAAKTDAMLVLTGDGKLEEVKELFE